MAGIELMLLHRTAIEENHQELLDYLFIGMIWKKILAEYVGCS